MLRRHDPARRQRCGGTGVCGRAGTPPELWGRGGRRRRSGAGGCWWLEEDGGGGGEAGCALPPAAADLREGEKVVVVGGCSVPGEEPRGARLGWTWGYRRAASEGNATLAPQPSFGSPPARRASWDGQGDGRRWGETRLSWTPPAEALQSGPEPWHKLMQPPEPCCFSG